ncbi:MAG TPA: 4-alpha-glucanotransferase [Rectinemataceae bacterium]|nr:4-alpha-glucanotransferase [Rectinemataceae bacterium]
MHMKRASGILLHPSSLPGPGGIGELGPAALEFVHRLAEAGQGLWQTLPLGPTGYGDSPYAPFSTFAGNDLLISLELLAAEGLLEKGEMVPPYPVDPERVDFGPLVAWKKPLLDKAAGRFLAGASPTRLAEYRSFVAANADWLPEYALFMAIKNEYDAKSLAAGRFGDLWNNYWPEALALRDPDSLAAEKANRSEAIARVEILQFLFFEQWARVKKAANDAGILVVGDIPIFVALDSADVWTRRDLFLLDDKGQPTVVAGVPPDYFSADGQLWGNPLYNWDAHATEGFAWWIARLRSVLKVCDAVRIDHFRGFEAFWAVPFGDKTARRGEWRKAPGRQLFAKLREIFGAEAPIIAEDLGFITEEVKSLRDESGLPGMRVLEFAFDANESGSAFNPENGFLPHNYAQRTVVYTGTHDNDTLAGWLDKASPAERNYVSAYLGCAGGDPVKGLVREAWKSVAAWAVAPMQDILGLGSEARMNTPSTLGGNWSWRMKAGAFDAALAAGLAEQSRLYGRGRGL